MNFIHNRFSELFSTILDDTTFVSFQIPIIKNWKNYSVFLETLSKACVHCILFFNFCEKYSDLMPPKKNGKSIFIGFSCRFDPIYRN